MRCYPRYNETSINTPAANRPRLKRILIPLLVLSVIYVSASYIDNNTYSYISFDIDTDTNYAAKYRVMQTQLAFAIHLIFFYFKIKSLKLPVISIKISRIIYEYKRIFDHDQQLQ